MSVNLSPLGGAGWQFLDNSGNVLSGGLLYTYSAGTTTPLTTYQDATGTTANANPVVLDAAGRVSGEVWLTAGLNYKLVLKTSTGTTLWTADNISGGTDAAASVLAQLAASGGSSLIGFLQSGTGAVATTVQSKLRETVSVLDFGADPTGNTDSTLAIQNTINAAGNNGMVFIPDGTYVAENIYVDFDNVQIECRGLFDMSGKSNPLFILGQQANGSVSAAARINIVIRGLNVTGDRTLGSKAVFFRRCSTSKLVDCKFWFIDYGFNGDGFPGHTYESLLCEFTNLDIRYCNYGIYDNDGSFQGSKFFGGRIEANLQQGVVTNSPNISFIGSCIEGNNTAAALKPELSWGSLGGALNLTDCYFEQTGNSTKMIEVVSGSGSCALTINGGSYYMNDAANRYLATTARTSLSLTVIGGLYSSFKNWLSGTVSGDYSVLIRPSFTNVDPLITADTTFTSDAAYYQYRRASGLVTNKNISVNSLFSASSLSLVGGLEKTHYVNGDTSATQTVVPVAQFSGTTAYLVEVIGVGRGGSTVSGGFKMYVLRNGDGSIANYSVDYQNGATGTSLVAANNSGNLEIQGLATSRAWNFFSFIRGRV